MKPNAKRLFGLIRQITVEPILFLNFLALPFFSVSQHAVLYKSVCLQFYSTLEPEGALMCDHLRDFPDIEDSVQKRTSTWSMFVSLSYFIPAIVSNIFLGAWSDQNGRKVSILSGFAGLVVMCTAYTTLAVRPFTPLYAIILANIFSGLTGYISMVMISTTAYLADVVPDKSKLTFRMIILMTFRYSADVIGSFLTSVTLEHFGAAITTLLAQGFFALAFFYTLVRLYQLSPDKLRKLTEAKERARNNEDSTKGKLETPVTKEPKKLESDQEKSAGCFLELKKTLQYVVRLYKDVGLTIFRRRLHHRRLYIYVCTVIYFCYILCEIGLQHGNIMSLYVFHRPFNWSPSELGKYRGVQSVCGLVGTILGAVVNRYFHLDDTTTMLLGIASGFFHLTIIGASQASWMLYLAVVAGAFNSLLTPALKSFLIHQVEQNEVGKVLAANGIAADLAFVVSTLLFTNIYKATVTVYPGTVFLIAAGTYFLCFCLVFWMRIDRNKDGSQKKSKEISSSSTAGSTTEPISLASVQSSTTNHVPKNGGDVVGP